MDFWHKFVPIIESTVSLRISMGLIGSKLFRIVDEGEFEAEKEPIVTTKFGKLQGKLSNAGGGQARAFLGIPFARPPIGELRFRKPLPPIPWEGIRQATSVSPQCPQKLFSLTTRFLAYLGRLSGISDDEDCLYLNVFTPIGKNGGDHGNPALPVMVIVHGGAFVNGSAVQLGDRGICQNFVINHGLIVVTVQYRLGLLGFYSTGDDSDCSDDNCGLWDLTMALHWVRENIFEFGGDPNNVTLMGQSAGGAAIDMLSVSPHSRDLFQKVILMAGNSKCPWAWDEEAVERSRKVAHKAGIFTNDCVERTHLLRQLPAHSLALGLLDEEPPMGLIRVPIAPRQFDRKFFPKSVEELRREAASKPTLLGATELEGLFYMMLHTNKNYSLCLLHQMVAKHFPEAQFPNKFGQLRSEALKMFWEDEGVEKYRDPRAKIGKALAELFSDLFCGIGTQRHVLEQLELGNQHIYLYSFDHFNNLVVRLMEFFLSGKIWQLQHIGCTHASEVVYFFGTEDLFKIGLMNSEDRKMMEKATKLWANFCKFGDPNGSKLSEEDPSAFCWKPVTQQNPSQCLSLKPRPEMLDNFQNGRPKEWIRLLGNK